MANEWEQNTRRVAELPSNSEIEREKDPTRKEILAAIQRVLVGHPKIVSPGAYSISDLAKEAGHGRHHLYQDSADLRHRYEYLRDRANEPTQKEVALQRKLDRTEAELVRMEALQTQTKQKAKDWKELAELLARAINTLEEELHQEQVSTSRLARKLRRLEQQLGQTPPIITMHRQSRRERGQS